MPDDYAPFAGEANFVFILGVNAFHGDSSACLLRDGEIVVAAEEERFRRIKHWAGFPSEAIVSCLNEAGISLNEVKHIAINSDHMAHLDRKLRYVLTKRPDVGLLLDRFRNRSKRTNIEDEFAECFPEASLGNVTFHHVEHHLAHMASAHLVSPFDKSVVISIDGFGDFSSGAWGAGNGSQIKVEQQVFFPHSLGVFYQALTQFIGFPNYGDEYKVMGLASYGKPSFMEQMCDIVGTFQDGTYKLNLDYFRHHKEKVDYVWTGGTPVVGELFSDKMARLMGIAPRLQDEPVEQCHKDIARSVQAMYEKAFFNLLRAAHDEVGVDNLTLAGGCAMNSVANGKVFRNSNFKRIYIQSAAGDAGGAIGAAFVVASRLGLTKKRFHMDHAYWGPSFSNSYHGELLKSNAAAMKQAGCKVEFIGEEDELCLRTASAIKKGQVVGWFQGRMEWGPRALGNRSILCDPRRAAMKDILNSKIKRRESFRPFAPSVLRETVCDWFEQDEDVPFMMQVFQIRQEKRALIPAVSHVDGSGRLQTVSAASNPRYYRLISEFYKSTKVPMLLNTSFNENEPVVCKPEEALSCFLRTKMDVLVLGDWFVSRGNC